MIRSEAALGPTRQTWCDGPDGCGAAIVKAKAPNGGWMRLQPWPDPTGPIRVEVLAQLRVLRSFEPSNRYTKRYERHTCVPARKAVARPPEQVPEQLPLTEEDA